MGVTGSEHVPGGLRLPGGSLSGRGLVVVRGCGYRPRRPGFVGIPCRDGGRT